MHFNQYLCYFIIIVFPYWDSNDISNNITYPYKIIQSLIINYIHILSLTYLAVSLAVANANVFTSLALISLYVNLTLSALETPSLQTLEASLPYFFSTTEVIDYPTAFLYRYIYWFY